MMKWENVWNETYFINCKMLPQWYYHCVYRRGKLNVFWQTWCYPGNPRQWGHSIPFFSIWKSWCLKWNYWKWIFPMALPFPCNEFQPFHSAWDILLGSCWGNLTSILVALKLHFWFCSMSISITVNAFQSLQRVQNLWEDNGLLFHSIGFDK